MRSIAKFMSRRSLLGCTTALMAMVMLSGCSQTQDDSEKKAQKPGSKQVAKKSPTVTEAGAQDADKTKPVSKDGTKPKSAAELTAAKKTEKKQAPNTAASANPAKAPVKLKAPPAKKPDGPKAKKAAAKPPVTGSQNPAQAQTPKKPDKAKDDTEAQRQKIQDHIYAMMRVEMEKAIKQRKDLLDSGKPPHDQEVRRLEGIIMRARSLLTEAGEEVGEVDPPIVQKKQP